MSMKRTELDKRQGLKITNELRQSGPRHLNRAPAIDRREQRERDRAAGLVPFAVKLHGDLIRRLHELATERSTPLHEVVDLLLRTGLKQEEKGR